MSMNHKPAWMEDELVKNIPERKLAFLEKLYVEGHNKNKKDMKSFLLPMMKKAKEENLTFTPQEMNAAIAAIKKHSTPQELEQINHIINKSQGKTDK